LAEYDDVINGPLFSLASGPPTLNPPLLGSPTLKKMFNSATVMEKLLHWFKIYKDAFPNLFSLIHATVTIDASTALRSNIFDLSAYPQTVAYLSKMAPMAKFKYAPFLIIETLDIGTVFSKDKL